MARLEWRFQRRSPLFWVLLVLVLLMTASINSGGIIPSGDDAKIRPYDNSAYAMAMVFTLVGFLVYGFFAALMAGLSILRDDEEQITDILHSTPLTAREYVLGKFFGVLAALGLVLVIQIVFAIWTYQLAPAGPPELRGPFEFSNYLVPALAMTAPFLLFVAGLAFAVGERTRQPVAVYMVPIVVVLSSVTLFWTFTPSWLDPRLDAGLRLFDPSGIRWLTQTFFKVDRGVEFYNHAPLQLDASFWLNRLWTLALPVVAVLLSIGHCRRQIAGEEPSQRGWRVLLPWRRSRLDLAEPSAVVRSAVSATLSPDALGTRRQPAFWFGVWAIVRAEIREIVTQPGVYVFALFAIFSIWEVATSAVAALETPMALTAGHLAVDALEIVTILIGLLLMVLIVESMYRDKASGLASILYSTPMRTGALLLGKTLGAVAIAAIMLVVCGAASLAMMSLEEGARLEIWPLLLVWGALLAPTFALWTAFVHLVFAWTGSRVGTYAICLAAWSASTLAHLRQGMNWLYNWDLWGVLRWSDLGLFELNRRMLILNRLWILSLSILLAVLALRTFARVERDSRARWPFWDGRTRRRVGLMAPWCVLAAVLGSWIVIEIHGGFQSPEAERRAREYWRQNFATWTDYRTADLSHVELTVHLEPASRQMQMAGTYTMRNRGTEPMGRLPFTIGFGFDTVTWTLDGREVQADDRSGLHVLELAEPLQPEHEVEVGFSYTATVPCGSTRNGGGARQFILPSGVLLHTLGHEFLPTPGYDPNLGVDADNRHEPADPRLVPLEEDTTAGLFSTRLVITAPSQYTVNSVGRKIEEYRSDPNGRSDIDGRTTVVWESEHPVQAINIVAGRYAVKRQGGESVAYHPAHERNVDAMLAALSASRRRFSDWFRPYPWSELRLSEFPNLAGNAQGFPTNISFSEGLGFLTREDGDHRLAFIVAAHEAAHQWWGHLVTPTNGPGGDVLVEGAAHYAALLLLESEVGTAGRMAFARQLERQYLSRRRVDAEVPLAEIRDDGSPSSETVIYDKGAWALWMLHQHLGQDAALKGMRTFFARFPAGQARPKLDDLISTLRPLAPSPESYDAFVDQWFDDVILPKFRLSKAAIEPTDRGYEITATIENSGTGRVPVAVAAMRGERFASEGTFREARTAITLGAGERRTLRWTSDFEPERLVVDPDLLVLQADRADAVVLF